MGRRRRYPPLRVYQNNLFVGELSKEPSGAISFRYDERWLEKDGAYPVSLSLPLREDAYKGGAVSAVFENLLPDSEAIRRRVAESVGAGGSDAFSLLAAIGRDCVGALQFLTGDDEIPRAAIPAIIGDPIDEQGIEKLLNNLVKAPLGLNREEDFRISIAGAQEKTALLYHDGVWKQPHGTTPTTHIFKTAIGRLPNGIDLSNSVENEFYCLTLLKNFGLPVAEAEIQLFGSTKSLVLKRFDREWTADGRLLRLPQEDCCQALSIPPARKYESDGGPGIIAIVELLKGSDLAVQDQRTFFQAQLLFWLLAATDGHAKNFSIFLTPGGGYRLTPLYDVLTAQPSLDSRQIERKQMKLAMCAGDSRHYRVDEIQVRHFIQTGNAAGVPRSVMRSAIEEIVERIDSAFAETARLLPNDFPEALVASVEKAVRLRAENLTAEELTAAKP